MRLPALARAHPDFPALVALTLLAVFTATRLGLAAFTGVDLVPLSLWPGIFLKGLWFDWAVLAVLAAPLCLYEALAPSRWRARAWHARLRLGFLFCLLAGALFVAASEATFWLEFYTRFNFIAVDYLLYRKEVVGNIQESYPVAAIFSGIGAAAAGLVWVLRARVRACDARPPSARRRAVLLLAAVVLPALSLNLADLDQLEGSGNAYADELAGNGVFSFAAAMRRNELDYDKFYKTMPQEAADAVLKGLGVLRPPLSAAPAGLGRPDDPVDPVPFSRRPRNVVLISVESLSASLVGAYGSTEKLTPRLDRLAREGLLFERFYATGTRTVRGLEALSVGVPPVPGQSLVRRPRMEHLATLGGLLRQQGYAVLFLYGGYGTFDNMSPYFRANDYEVLDRGDFPRESVVFANIWGVADESLYDNALAAFDREVRSGRPFFAHIMTTSNHRPYTYPDGRIENRSPGGRAGAVKYSDYAIGKFIADARARPWFKDTLFVLTADHCASAAGRAKLPVQGYRIPLVLYAPALLKPGVYKETVSQIDLAPTLLEILGKRGDDLFYGRSVFQKGKNHGRAFISNYQELGYLKNGLLTVLLPRRRVETYRVDPVTSAETPVSPDNRLVEEAVAYYQTAARAFKIGALHLPPPRRPARRP